MKSQGLAMDEVESTCRDRSKNHLDLNFLNAAPTPGEIPPGLLEGDRTLIPEKSGGGALISYVKVRTPPRRTEITHKKLMN